MLIVFILLLTLINVALKLTSLSLRASRKITNRLAKINAGKPDETGFRTFRKKALNTTSRVASAGLLGARMVISTLRNILLVILPVVFVLDIIVFIMLTAASSGYVAYLASEDSQLGSVQQPGSGGNDNIQDGRGRILLVGDSRTVGLAVYVLGMSSNEEAVIGATPDGDYIVAKSSMGISWMKSKESVIDEQVTSDTAVVINMGTNDAVGYETTASEYIEWLNEKAEDWTASGATVWFMNVGPVDDEGSSPLKTSYVTEFNKAVKEGLNSNIGYIDEYSALVKYGNIIYDAMGIHYDVDTYKEVWKLLQNTVVSD